MGADQTRHQKNLGSQVASPEENRLGQTSIYVHFQGGTVIQNLNLHTAVYLVHVYCPLHVIDKISDMPSHSYFVHDDTLDGFIAKWAFVLFEKFYSSLWHHHECPRCHSLCGREVELTFIRTPVCFVQDNFNQLLIDGVLKHYNENFERWRTIYNAEEEEREKERDHKRSLLVKVGDEVRIGEIPMNIVTPLYVITKVERDEWKGGSYSWGAWAKPINHEGPTEWWHMSWFHKTKGEQ